MTGFWFGLTFFTGALVGMTIAYAMCRWRVRLFLQRIDYPKHGITIARSTPTSAEHPPKP